MIEIVVAQTRADFEKKNPSRHEWVMHMPDVTFIERPVINDMRFGALIEVWTSRNKASSSIFTGTIIDIDTEELLVLTLISADQLLWVCVQDIKQIAFDPIVAESITPVVIMHAQPITTH